MRSSGQVGALTGQSDVGALDTVLVKHARDAFVAAAAIAREWEPLNYTAPPAFAEAVREYERFAALLERCVPHVHRLPPRAGVGLDSIYVRDASIVCDRGVILCNMGKAARAGEPAALGAAADALGLPIAGRITGDGRIEGGDVAWLDDRTLVVGRGYRTNDAGIAQLRAILGDAVDRLLVVPLPHWRGPQDVFHLMSMLSPVDRDLAVVYAPLLPVPFRELLLARGYALVEVPDREFATLGANVLAVAPRRCIMLEGHPETRRRLERAGAEVYIYQGGEISLKGGGGPTCLTRPIWRVREAGKGG